MLRQVSGMRCGPTRTRAVLMLTSYRTTSTVHHSDRSPNPAPPGNKNPSCATAEESTRTIHNATSFRSNHHHAIQNPTGKDKTRSLGVTTRCFHSNATLNDASLRYHNAASFRSKHHHAIQNPTGENKTRSTRCFHSNATLNDAVELTSVRYPNVKRGNFAVLEERHVEFFRGVLDAGRVLTDESDVEGYNVDWIKMVRGASKVVLKPKTTEEVSAILKYCNAEKLAVCPQGGNTGLVGGSVPVFDEVIISTSLMNKIISVDELSGVLVCQAGCVLETLDNHLSERGLMMPLDLGAKGSCQIGGNVSTNAGGIRLLRYGSLQGSILGIEAVTANGDVIDCLSTLKKDNTGYHLKHLFVGSEGTLGIVTKVAIQCPNSPKAVNVAFLGLKSFPDVLTTFHSAKQGLGEILSSCEMMDLSSLQAATENLGLRCPLGEHPFYMLLETSGSSGSHDEEKLNAFLETAMEGGVVEDGTVASEPSRIKTMWELRENIPEGLNRDGFLFMYDVSLPLANFYDIVPLVAKRLEGSAAIRCNGFGHIGDGNLHLNITSGEFDHDIMDRIEPFVFEWTSALKGSVSAEHGIGFKKTQFIHFSKSPSALSLMKNMKNMMDPNGILNPYKVLPQE